jgi:hypothetical protein
MAEELLSRIRAEIAARMEELRPLLDEYEQMVSAAEALGLQTSSYDGAAPRSAARRGTRGSSPGSGSAGGTRAKAKTSGASSSSPARKGPSRERAPRGAAQQAILAALEHGSHTVGELVVVTAISTPTIRENLTRLLKAGAVERSSREGKAAYALPA